MKKLIFFVLIYFSNYIFIQNIFSQTAILTTGGNSQSNEYTFNYSIGQIFYCNFQNDTISINDGVQQPFEIFIQNQISDFNYDFFSINIFPNPVNGILNLNIENSFILLFSYQLIDINGKKIKTDKIYAQKSSIDLGDLSPAAYFLMIQYNNITIKTFKIIKSVK